MRLSKFGIYQLVFANILAFFISQHIGYFDSPLFFLQIAYPSEGLHPGRDFIIYYPYGLSMVSWIFQKTFFGFLNFKFLVWPIHFLIQIYFLITLKKTFNRSIQQSLIYFLMIIETIAFAVLGTEPFSLLITLILLLQLYQLNLDNNNFRAFFSWATILFLLRWDRFLYTIVAWLVFIIIQRMKVARFDFTIFKKISICYLNAVIFGLGLIYIYTPKNFLKNIQHIFIDPLIIGRYRSKHFLFNFDFLNFDNWYLLLLIGYLYIFIKFLRLALNSEKVFLYLLGISFLPYTISRPDISHFFPFFLSSSIALCVGMDERNWFQKNPFVIWCTSLLAIAIGTGYTLYLRSHPIEDTCTSYLKSSKYRSLFVGNASYAQFVINFPRLYLTNLSLRPATKYISDEPGIQNTCEVQEEIIRELKIAPKPTVYLLNQSKITDLNNTNKIASCNLIERYFAESTIIKNECVLGRYSIEIREGK